MSSTRPWIATSRDAVGEYLYLPSRGSAPRSANAVASFPKAGDSAAARFADRQSISPDCTPVLRVARPPIRDDSWRHDRGRGPGGRSTGRHARYCRAEGPGTPRHRCFLFWRRDSDAGHSTLAAQTQALSFHLFYSQVQHNQEKVEERTARSALPPE